MKSLHSLATFFLCIATLSFPLQVCANLPPQAQALAKILKEDTIANITLKGNDPERGKISYTITQQPEHGVASLSANKVTYKPQANYNGTDSFQYIASDGEAYSMPAVVNLNIKPVNDKPIARPQTMRIEMGVATEISLLALDADGDDLSYALVKKPKYGKVVLQGSTATYTPNSSDFEGEDLFTFKAKDKKSSSKPAAVNVHVGATGLASVGLVELSFGEGQPDMYVLARSSNQIAINLAPSPDSNIADFNIQVNKGQDHAVANKVAGRWILDVDGTSLARAGSVLIGLTISNTKLGTSTNYATTLEILMPTQTVNETIDSLGGKLMTPAGTILVPPNDLSNPVGVKIEEAVTPAGTLTYLISFDQDVSAANLQIVLPDPNLSASTSSNAAKSKSTHQLAQPSALNTFDPEGFSVPYSKSEYSLGHHWEDTNAWFTDSGDHRLRSGVPISISGLFDCNGNKCGLAVNKYPASSLFSVMPKPVTPIDVGNYEPVLFVHGYLLSPTTSTLGGGKKTWENFPKLATYSQRLNNVHLIPFEFRWATDARFVDVAGDLVRRINEIHQMTGKKIHIVAHSFGGVLARTVLQKLSDGPTDQEKNDARAAVKSLLTLGSPHSGISDNTTNTDPPLPPGQDAASFEGCAQISCYVMGEYVSSIAAMKSALGVDETPGEHALLLANTVNKLPNIPILVGIGLTADRGSNGKYDTGDYLISYRGQRFHPNDNTRTLRKAVKVGEATVSEIVLGSTRDVGPDDPLNVEEKATERPKGYLHSGITGVANLWKDDGENGFGVEAAPKLNCSDDVATCTHAGYLLFKELVKPVISNDLPPIPYEDFGACPFEGCVYRQWIANEFTPILFNRNTISQTSFTVNQGERVDAITGVVITTTPGEFKVFKTIFIDGIRVEAGNLIYSLTPMGEGTSKMWYKGKLIPPNMDILENLELIKITEYTWWIQIRNSKGQVGWTNMPDNFINKDIFG